MAKSKPAGFLERTAWNISSRGMRRAPLTELELLTGSATVLEGDASGETVFRMADGRVVKLFYQRRLFSSAVLRPYARRFDENAKALRRRGIPCVETERLFAVPDARRHVVVYRWLDGTPLRDALAGPGADRDDLMRCLAKFLAKLHDEGIFFRSLHFANVLVLEDGNLGLIDVEDLSVSRAALRLGRRVRNFRHLWRYQEDVEAILGLGLEQFVDAYMGATQLADNQRDTARRRILDTLLGLAIPKKRAKTAN
jgi:tRNA A-37 threonylcarbamoyl transferase component Bud32